MYIWLIVVLLLSVVAYALFRYSLNKKSSSKNRRDEPHYTFKIE